MAIHDKKVRADHVKDKDARYNVKRFEGFSRCSQPAEKRYKKDLVDRIKALILKVKPNAFDQ